ncbi:MAG: FeS assembly SUF system protein [Bacteroidetes bacterium 4572_112]|nr:MAG: FeS assembly SUF system protein [Bacteroidetes bacterium 4572_112]
MSEDKKAPIDFLALEGQVMKALKTVYDPEIPVDVYELGMIYEIEVDDDAVAHVVMTLTTPNCPVADSLVNEVKERVAAVPGISQSDIVLTFEPPWDKSMMSEEAQLELGYL